MLLQEVDLPRAHLLGCELVAMKLLIAFLEIPDHGFESGHHRGFDLVRFGGLRFSGLNRCVGLFIYRLKPGYGYGLLSGFGLLALFSWL